jgi:hypothetical protein
MNRPIYNLGKGSETRVCKDWNEWNELIANVYPGAFYPSSRPAGSKTRYLFETPEENISKAFDLVGVSE